MVNKPDKSPYERMIFVCCNEREPGEAACANRGSVELHKTLKEYVKSKGLKDRLRVTRSLCLGQCEKGPNICVMPDNVWYHDVKTADIPAIIDRHVKPLES